MWEDSLVTPLASFLPNSLDLSHCSVNPFSESSPIMEDLLFPLLSLPKEGAVRGLVTWRKQLLDHYAYLDVGCNSLVNQDADVSSMVFQEVCCDHGQGGFEVQTILQPP